LRIAFVALLLLLIPVVSIGQADNDRNSIISEEPEHYLTRVNSLSDYSNFSDKGIHQINDLINEALNIYIDQSYRLTTKQIKFRKSEKEMIVQMDNLVNQSLELFQINHYFDGFSYLVVKKLIDIKSLQWGNKEYLFLGDDQAERDFVLSSYIDHEIRTLEDLIHNEVNSFILENNIEIPVVEFMNKLEELATSSVVTRNTEGLIPPIEFTLDWPIEAAVKEMEYIFGTEFIAGYNAYKKANSKTKKRKKDYTEELISVIKQNSKQLASLQKSIVSINQAGIERDRQQNDILQMQIDELQNQINDLSKNITDNKHPLDININFEKRIDLREVTIQFDKNSTIIDPTGKVLLNRVFDSLIKSPKYKVVITGFADKSGNTEFNVYISQQRAREIQNYLAAQGIDKKRLIVNYMGDLYSSSENSSDRKVVIEFINKMSSIDFSSN
jgi:outer membrane protein OmpA-like peptidoglycan-associated protein